MGCMHGRMFARVPCILSGADTHASCIPRHVQVFYVLAQPDPAAAAKLRSQANSAQQATGSAKKKPAPPAEEPPAEVEKNLDAAEAREVVSSLSIVPCLRFLRCS